MTPETDPLNDTIGVLKFSTRKFVRWIIALENLHAESRVLGQNGAFIILYCGLRSQHKPPFFGWQPLSLENWLSFAFGRAVFLKSWNPGTSWDIVKWGVFQNPHLVS